MPKKQRCSVPGCITYATPNNFLKIPENLAWRTQWLSAIRKTDWVIDKKAVVCTKHFKQSDFTISSKSKGENQEKKVKVITATLIPNTVPSVFHQEDVYYLERKLNCVYEPKEMYEIYPRDSKGPELFEDIEAQETNYIIDFCYLTLMYKQKLNDYLSRNWKDIANEESIIFFTVNCEEVTPRIPVSIKIDKNLQTTVTLSGRLMDPADLTWVLPMNGKLNHWSQMITLMNVFGK